MIIRNILAIIKPIICSFELSSRNPIIKYIPPIIASKNEIKTVMLTAIVENPNFKSDIKNCVIKANINRITASTE